MKGHNDFACRIPLAIELILYQSSEVGGAYGYIYDTSSSSMHCIDEGLLHNIVLQLSIQGVACRE